MEPWAYDKHLILLKWYDDKCSTHTFHFSTVKFWLQIHGLLVNRLTFETAMELGKSVGVVSCSKHRDQVIGGDFLRVQVSIDVSKPLCRGRKVFLGQNRANWVSFQYEKLSKLLLLVWHGVS